LQPLKENRETGVVFTFIGIKGEYNNGKWKVKNMKINTKSLVFITTILIIFASSGCLEKQLTIKTEPSAALVELNDEEIGVSPVTVGFNWYGDYNVRISKDGYETLKTHRLLKAPWYDKFPFDFFAQILPTKRVDKYEWQFTLEPKKEVDKEQLIKEALKLKEQL
jgi:hypothetical protein